MMSISTLSSVATTASRSVPEYSPLVKMPLIKAIPRLCFVYQTRSLARYQAATRLNFLRVIMYGYHAVAAISGVPMGFGKASRNGPRRGPHCRRALLGSAYCGHRGGRAGLSFASPGQGEAHRAVVTQRREGVVVVDETIAHP